MCEETTNYAFRSFELMSSEGPFVRSSSDTLATDVSKRLACEAFHRRSVWTTHHLAPGPRAEMRGNNGRGAPPQAPAARSGPQALTPEGAGALSLAPVLDDARVPRPGS